MTEEDLGSEFDENETRPVLDGCQSPGPAIYVQDDESLKVVGTCFNSDNAFVGESRF